MTGRRLSHYQIAEEISRGGMGVVYRAIDLRLNREVALKVLPDDVTRDADRKRRFIAEAQAASALEHPHIAVIHDVDEADGVTFIAMEMIRGETLSDLLARQRLSPMRAIEIMSEVASGLARAHERQIVHRDMKPANVMLTEAGHAKIIDFGIAKLMEAPPVADCVSATVSAGITAAGMVLGTVSYMSPEQTRGERVDPRSDIFTFGVILHEVLSGQRPFDGRSPADTASAVLHQPPPRLAALGGSIPLDIVVEMQRVVDKCLAKDPADRYQGMKDLIVDLRALRRRLEAGTQTEPAPAARARGRWIGAVAFAALLIAAFVVVMRRPAPGAPGLNTAPSPTKPSVAVLYFDNTTGDQQLDWLRTGIPEMVVTDLSQSADLEVVSTDRLYEIVTDLQRADDRVLSQEVVRAVAERTGVTNVVVGSYVKAGDAIRINVRLQEVGTGRIVASERVEGAGEDSLFRMVDDLSQRIRSRIQSLRADVSAALLSRPGDADPAPLDRSLSEVSTTSIEAFRYYAEGVEMHERARADEAIILFEKAIAIDDTFAMAYAKLAVARGNIGHFAELRKNIERAWQLADRLPMRERHYVAGLYHTYVTPPPDGPRRSLEAYTRCVELDPGYQSCRHNLGLRMIQLERFEEARGQYAELIRRGTTNPTAFGNLSNAQLAVGDLAGARRTIEMFIARHPENGLGHIILGEILTVEGRYDDAIAAFARGGVLDPDRDVAITGRIRVEGLKENWSAAEDRARALGGDQDPVERANAASMLARLALFQGRSREAVDWFLRAAKEEGATPRGNLMSQEAARVLALTGRAQAALAATRLPSPDDPVAARTIPAWLLALNGQRAAADALVTQMEARGDELAPQRWTRTLQNAKGLVALASQDATAAVAAFEAAQAALTPRGTRLGTSVHVWLWFNLGDAYLAAGRDVEALRQYEKVASAGHERWGHPVQYVRSFYRLAKLFEKRGDSVRAREMYRRFVGYWKDGDIDREQIAEAQRKLRDST